jgi:hypothetical protein
LIRITPIKEGDEGQGQGQDQGNKKSSNIKIELRRIPIIPIMLRIAAGILMLPNHQQQQQSKDIQQGDGIENLRNRYQTVVTIDANGEEYPCYYSC